MEEGQAIELPRTRRGTGQPTELSQQPRASRPSHGRRSTLAAVAQQLQQQEAEEEAQEAAVAAGEANGRWSTISKAEVVLLTSLGLVMPVMQLNILAFLALRDIA